MPTPCAQILDTIGPCFAELSEGGDVSLPALHGAALDPSAVLVESSNGQQRLLLVTSGKGDLSVFRDGQQAGANMSSAAGLCRPIRLPAVLWYAYQSLPGHGLASQAKHAAV